MNKYFIITGLVVVVIVGGVIYRIFLLPKSSVPVESGQVKNITITAKKNEWRFVPEDIDLVRGDKVIMAVVNEDDYDHGLAIDAFGVSQRMPAKSTIRVEFVVTQEGDFPFYCSVPCGEGLVNGVKRTHFDMIGKLHVKNAVIPLK